MRLRLEGGIASKQACRGFFDADGRNFAGKSTSSNRGTGNSALDSRRRSSASSKRAYCLARTTYSGPCRCSGFNNSSGPRSPHDATRSTAQAKAGQGKAKATLDKGGYQAFSRVGVDLWQWRQDAKDWSVRCARLARGAQLGELISRQVAQQLLGDVANTLEDGLAGVERNRLVSRLGLRKLLGDSDVDYRSAGLRVSGNTVNGHG